ncbi:MAG: PAS domain-containing protein [Legionellales bacterium]|nr:PAS domain-containing protein [Legionellales bacterium]
MQTNTKLLQQIILNLPNYIFWKDINLLYQGCNKNFAQSLGFTHIEEVIGKSDEEMPWTESSAEIYREEDLQILSTGTPISNKVVK